MPNDRKVLGFNETLNVPRALGTSDRAVIPGDLKVDGVITTGGNVIAIDSHVNLGDRFIVLNADHTGTGASDAEDAGIVFNVDPDNAKKQTGNIAFSGATITVAGSDVTASFPANALVIVSGAEDSANDGLYEVHSSSFSTDTTITFKDATTNTPSSDVLGIVQTAAFTANADDDTVEFAPTKIMILKSDTANNDMKIGYGTAGGSITYNDIVHSGDTITADSIAADDITAGDAAVEITTTSGDVLIDAPTGQSVDLQINGSNVIEVAGASVAINQPVDVSSAAFSMSVIDNTADAWEVKEGSNQYIAIDTTDSDEKIEIFKDLYFGQDELFAITDNSSSALIIGQGVNAYMTFDTTDSAEKIIVGKKIDLDASVFEMDTQATSFTIKDNEAAAWDLKEGSNSYIKAVTTNSGEKVEVGQALHLLNATLSVANQASDILVLDNSGTALEIKEGSNAYVTIDTTNSSERVLISQSLTVEAATVHTKNSDTALLIENEDNTAAFNFVVKSDASGENHQFQVKNAAEIVYESGSNTYCKLNVVDGVVAGNLLHVDSSGNMAKADNDAGGDRAHRVVAVAAEANSTGSAAEKLVMASMGRIALVKFTSAPASGDVGKAVYLDATAGQATVTAPSVGSGDLLVEIGTLMSSTAIDSLYQVLFQPRVAVDVG